MKFSQCDSRMMTGRLSGNRLLYSCGNFLDKKVFVWDTKTGNIVASGAMAEALVAMTWGGLVRDIKWRETQNYRVAEAFKEKLALVEVDTRAGKLSR